MSASGSSTGVCLLFEGRYAEGATALLNSLYAAGFRGDVFCGFRGAVPAWLDAGAVAEPAEGLRVHRMSIGNSRPLVMQKARFVLEVWEGPGRECESLAYFDADILVMARWGFFEDWIRAGLAVCADVNAEMPAGHPLRKRWKEAFDPGGERPERELHWYFNAGFFALERRYISFLGRWKGFVEVAEEELRRQGRPSELPRTDPLSVPDQDAFNAAIMLGEEPLSPLGRDGMGFQPGGGNYVMAHAIGPLKPWAHFLFANALRRRRPTLAERLFVANLRSPIAVYSTAGRVCRRLDLLAARAIAAAIGR